MKDLGITGNDITVSLLFECEGNYWSTTNQIYDSNTYLNRIINFSGIDLSQSRPEDGQIAPNTISFDLVDIERDYTVSSFYGAELTLTVLIDDAEAWAFAFTVKSCVFNYGLISFECEDFLQQYILESEFPNTDLINGIDTSGAEHAGSEKACVPVIFGLPYIPLRTIWYSSERYYVLGENSGTYTIEKSSYPVDWNTTALYETPTYTFPQSTIGDLRVFQVHDEGVWIGSFQKDKKLHDMPTQYSNSNTSSMTSPADVISYVLQKIGVPSAKINSVDFAAAATVYATAGIEFNYGYFERRNSIEVLCELLIACDSFLRVTDTVSLVPRSQTSLMTLDRNDISDYGFDPVVLSKRYDAAYLKYYPDVQCGEGITIDVTLDGATYTSISSDTLEIPFYSDTILLQQISRVYFRRNFWKIGDISFKSGFYLLGVQPGDVLTIDDDDLYHGGTIVIDSILINNDFTMGFSGILYSDSIGEYSDYSASERSVDTDEDTVISPGLGSVDQAAQDKLDGIPADADKTTVTTMGNALDEAQGIGQAMITTGAISNHMTTPTLKIDFDTAKITVNSPSGLEIQSSEGIQVSSGGSIDILNGGDLNFFTDGSSSSSINFGSSGTTVAAMTIRAETDPDINNPDGVRLYVEPLVGNCDLTLGTSTSPLFYMQVHSSNAINLYADEGIIIQAGDDLTLYGQNDTVLQAYNDVYIQSIASGTGIKLLTDATVGPYIRMSICPYDLYSASDASLTPNPGDGILYISSTGGIGLQVNISGAVYYKTLAT